MWSAVCRLVVNESELGMHQICDATATKTVANNQKLVLL